MWQTLAVQTRRVGYVKQPGCWSVCAHRTPGSKHHPTSLSVLHLVFVYVWILVLVPGSGLLTATRVKTPRMGTRMARNGSGFSGACYKPGPFLHRAVILRHSSLRYLLFWTDCGNPGLSVDDTSSKQVCCSTCHWFKQSDISYVLDGSCWAKSFAVGTAQPTLPCYSSQVSSPGKSCHHPLSFSVFPGVLDHGCVMPRALFPSWSPAFIMHAFCGFGLPSSLL